MGDPIFRLEGVEKTYRQGRQAVTALKDATLDLVKDEFLVLVGPSGCGKSTLLNLVVKLIQPTSGKITWSSTVDVPGAIGMVFQNPVLLPWRSVLTNVLLPAEILGLERKEARERAVELLKLVGLTGFESAYPYQLSGGMQQRVALCRALLSDPPLLLMDEPFGALDAITRESMNLEMQRIWAEQKKSVAFVTHSITEAIFLSDRIVVMQDNPGRITAIITNELSRPRDVHTFKEPLFAEYSVQIREMLEGNGRVVDVATEDEP